MQFFTYFVKTKSMKMESILLLIFKQIIILVLNSKREDCLNYSYVDTIIKYLMEYLSNN